MRFLAATIFLFFNLLVCGASGQTPWLASTRVGNQAWFLTSNSILKFDLSYGYWLDPQPLNNSGSTALAFDSAGGFVGAGSTLYRYNSSAVSLGSSVKVSGSIEKIFLDGNLAIVVSYDDPALTQYFTVFDRQTMAQVSSLSLLRYHIDGLAHFPASRTFLGYTETHLAKITYNQGGILSPLQVTYRTFLGSDEPNQPRLWAAPDRSELFSQSGPIFDAVTAASLGSLGQTVQDLKFDSGNIYALSGTQLFQYDAKEHIKLASLTLASGGDDLYVEAGRAFAFSKKGSFSQAELARLIPTRPAAEVNPSFVAYTVDLTLQDAAGNLLLLSKGQSSLFRWSASARGYTGSFYLPKMPLFAGSSTDRNSVYFVNEDWSVGVLDLSVPQPVEHILFYLTSAPRNFAVTSEYLSVCDNVLEVLNLSGTQVTMTYQIGSTVNMVWDPVYRRLYQSGATDFSARTIAANGSIDYAPVDLSATYSRANNQPFVVSPDGRKLAGAEGAVYNAEPGITKAANLANPFSFGAWTDSGLATVRLVNGVTQLQTWKSANEFAKGSEVQFSGTPAGIANTPQGLVALTQEQGAPRFHLLDSALNPVFESPQRPVPPVGLAVESHGDDNIILTWEPALGSTVSQYLIRYRMHGSQAWTDGPLAAGDATEARITGLLASSYYEFQIQTEANGMRSDFSASLDTYTLIAGTPQGEPYHLAASEVLSDQITLTWTDHVPDNTGFRIFRDHAVWTDLPAGTTYYTDTGLQPGATHVYQVQVLRDPSLGSISEALTLTTSSAAGVPVAPSGLATFASPGRISLSWQDRSQDELHFAVDRSPAGSPVWQEMAVLDPNINHWDDLTVSPGSSYLYRIRAIGTGGASVSNTVAVTAMQMGGVFQGLSQNVNGICYFVLNSPDRIERYDIRQRTWLSPIILNAACTALWVDDLAVYAAEGSGVFRYNLDGTGRTSMGNFTSSVDVLFSANGELCFGASAATDPWYTVNRATAQYISSTAAQAGASGPVYSSKLKQIFLVVARDNSTGKEMRSLTLSSKGETVILQNSPYLYSQKPTKAFVFPSGDRVVSDSGLVYSSQLLQMAGGLGAPFLDLDFVNSQLPMALREGRLTAYSSSLKETGTYALQTPGGVRLAVSGQDALVFSPDNSGHGLAIEVVNSSMLTLPVAQPVVDPRAVSFSPDFTFFDGNGDLLILSKNQSAVFRWSPSRLRYFPTVALTDHPTAAAYLQNSRTLYIGHDAQVVRKMSLTPAKPVEVPAFNTPAPLLGLTAAGDFPFVAMKNFDLTYGGDWIGQPKDYWTGAVNVWNPVKKAVYHKGFLYSPFIIKQKVDPIGNLLDYNWSSEGSLSLDANMVVSPDGTKVADGSGGIFDADSLNRVSYIYAGMTDALWLPDSFLTLHSTNDGSKSLVSVRDPGSYAVVRSLPAFDGSPRRLLMTQDGKVVVVTLDTQVQAPHFYILAPDLSIESEYDPRLSQPDPLSPVADSNNDMHLNPETGLYECTVTITNITADPLSGFDLQIHGLPAGMSLYNGSGSSSLSYHRVLQPGESITVELQLVALVDSGNPRLTFGTSIAGTEGARDLAVNQIIRNADGTVSFLFPTEPGSRYAVEYSSNIADWTTAAFGIQAAGTSVQWTDSGSPVTSSSPISNPRRFYRVRQVAP